MPSPRIAVNHIAIDERVELHFAGAGLHCYLIPHAGQMPIGKRHEPLALDAEDAPGGASEADRAMDARLRKVERSVIVAALDGFSRTGRLKRRQYSLPVQQHLNGQPVRHGYQFGDFVGGGVTVEHSRDEGGWGPCQQAVFM